MAPLVAFAGFMGSGKSSVGIVTARLLGWRFVDLDEEVARDAGMTIPEVFARFGESAFRKREAEVLIRSLSEPRDEGLVIALGGGTAEREEAVALLEREGGVVLLDVDGATAWERARGEQRPLAKDRDSFLALLASRRETYERVADWIVPVGRRSVDQIAGEVARVVGLAGTTWSRSWGQQLISTSRPSTIFGGEGCLAAVRGMAAEARGRGARPFVITDSNVEEAWGGTVDRLLESQEGTTPAFILAPGEPSKTVGNLEQCWEWLASQGARRDDVVVALGGGVVGDLAGFAAATYQRGVQLCQLPTTLLAQVDSSVGGKTAVNLPSGKNLVGAFYQPGIVVIDPETLSTLPRREFANGMGEVVKYALLAGDPLLTYLEENRELVERRHAPVLSHVIRSCVRYKAAAVEEDERDAGKRAVLNLGHTTAHALENTLGYGRVGHGEAVALGLLVALAVSETLLGLDPEIRRRTQELLRGVGLPTSIALPPAGAVRAAASRDKKATAVSAGFVGLGTLGEPVCGLDLPADVFERALEVVRA